MSESNLVVLPDMQAVENTEPEEIKAQEGIVSAASKKLDEEEKAFVGSGRAKMIFPHVVKTLRGFIEEDDRFAEVFANTVRTVSECCAASWIRAATLCLTWRCTAKRCSSISLTRTWSSR